MFLKTLCKSDRYEYQWREGEWSSQIFTSDRAAWEARNQGTLEWTMDN